MTGAQGERRGEQAASKNEEWFLHGEWAGFTQFTLFKSNPNKVRSPVPVVNIQTADYVTAPAEAAEVSRANPESV